MCNNLPTNYTEYIGKQCCVKPDKKKKCEDKCKDNDLLENYIISLQDSDAEGSSNDHDFTDINQFDNIIDNNINNTTNPSIPSTFRPRKNGFYKVKYMINFYYTGTSFFYIQVVRNCITYKYLLKSETGTGFFTIENCGMIYLEVCDIITFHVYTPTATILLNPDDQAEPYKYLRNKICFDYKCDVDQSDQCNTNQCNTNQCNTNQCNTNQCDN